MVDRAMQREILEELQKAYPEPVRTSDLSLFERENFNFNLFYLAGHGLIEGDESEEVGQRAFLEVTITPRGIDHLADDGGLGAILGVVTVKFHAETIREMLAYKINEQSIDPKEKQNMLRLLKTVPASALSEITKQLVATGISHIPNLFQLLQSFGQ